MATEQFNITIKELFTLYLDFMQFKNKEELNKGKDSLIKPEKITMSFNEFVNHYNSWLKATEYSEDYSPDDNYDDDGLPVPFKEDSNEEETY